MGCDAGAVTTKQRVVIVRGAYRDVRVPHERGAMRRVVAVIRVCPNCRSAIYVSRTLAQLRRLVLPVASAAWTQNRSVPAGRARGAFHGRK